MKHDLQLLCVATAMLHLIVQNYMKVKISVEHAGHTLSFFLYICSLSNPHFLADDGFGTFIMKNLAHVVSQSRTANANFCDGDVKAMRLL